jgi:hypothetical protein
MPFITLAGPGEAAVRARCEQSKTRATLPLASLIS